MTNQSDKIGIESTNGAGQAAIAAVDVVNAMARLIELKDRQALDDALIALVRQSLGTALGDVGMYRCVGDAGEEQWLTCAVSHTAPEATAPRALGHSLPVLRPLGDFLLGQQALRERRTVHLCGASQQLCQTAFPMTEGVATLGVLCVESSSPLALADRLMVEALLGFYRNVQSLLAYGERDTLTDLLNRKTFEGSFLKATLAQESAQFEDAAVNRRTASDVPQASWLAMIDIDHFKRVNDTFGHLIGDEVLLLLARLMRTNFRFNDQLYRFGGEEFVVLMQNVSAESAAHVFERLRTLTLEHSFPQVGKITISVGYSALRPGDTPDSAFARADKAVYYAKANGRNQCCHYETLVAQGHLTEADANIGEIELF
jgi:diguanylate cyclase (GGDEF)-like protein